MTLQLVPSENLAPSLPQRVVKVDVASMTGGRANGSSVKLGITPVGDGLWEVDGASYLGDGVWEQGDPKPGPQREALGYVTFQLVGDIHMTADDMIVGALKPMTVPLGGRIRLPVWTGRHGNWHIRVKKSWAPYPYAIRVPSGTSAISLADIPEYRGSAPKAPAPLY